MASPRAAGATGGDSPGGRGLAWSRDPWGPYGRLHGLADGFWVAVKLTQT
jgi:hypothetical protein